VLIRKLHGGFTAAAVLPLAGILLNALVGHEERRLAVTHNHAEPIVGPKRLVEAA